jgi:hypothetical protein
MGMVSISPKAKKEEISLRGAEHAERAQVEKAMKGAHHSLVGMP